MTVMAGLAVPAPAWSSSGGDRNAGDVWVDNVGQPPGPGHEMDPHLSCADINLWGSGLADAFGSFTIDGWAPSGSKEANYGASTWNYSHGSGRQVIAVIDVHALISRAAANGDQPQANQGYHFKLEFSQDPQKHKTFWVKCPAPSSTPPSSPPPPASPPPSSPPPSTPSSPSVVPSPPPVTASPTPRPAPKARPRRKPVARHRHRRRHHRPVRHRRPTPKFTG